MNTTSTMTTPASTNTSRAGAKAHSISGPQKLAVLLVAASGAGWAAEVSSATASGPVLPPVGAGTIGRVFGGMIVLMVSSRRVVRLCVPSPAIIRWTLSALAWILSLLSVNSLARPGNCTTTVARTPPKKAKASSAVRTAAATRGTRKR